MLKRTGANSTTFYVVLIALFSALIFALTAFLQIPFPLGSGYVNFGDALIFLSASLLGPLGGAVSGAVGSSLADLFSGYGIYAPFTFVVKGGEGFLTGILYMYVFKNRRPVLRRLFSTLIAGAWVAIGYFFTDLILTGDVRLAAINNFGFGLAQPIVSIVIALLVMPRLPVLFESVKYHTENDDEDLYEQEMLQREKDAAEGASEEKEAAPSDGPGHASKKKGRGRPKKSTLKPAGGANDNADDVKESEKTSADGINESENAESGSDGDAEGGKQR